MRTQYTAQDVEFLNRLADLLEEFGAGFSYTPSDDGTEIEVNGRQIFLGFLDQTFDPAQALRASAARGWFDPLQPSGEIPGPRIDWTQAPHDAQAWFFDPVGGPVWLALARLDVTTINSPVHAAGAGWVVVGDGPAPLFGWAGGSGGSFIDRPAW